MKSSLDLDFMKQAWDTWKDVSPPENLLSKLHQLRDGMFAIPDEFLQLGCDECRCLRVIQLDAARKTFLSKEASLYRKRGQNLFG
jgi:hypothetical protein